MHLSVFIQSGLNLRSEILWIVAHCEIPFNKFTSIIIGGDPTTEIPVLGARSFS